VKRRILVVLILALCAFGIYFGAKEKQLVETEAVGSVMCLSCMGLQQ
jgi:hypothetical protein